MRFLATFFILVSTTLAQAEVKCALSINGQDSPLAVTHTPSGSLAFSSSAKEIDQLTLTVTPESDISLHVGTGFDDSGWIDGSFGSNGHFDYSLYKRPMIQLHCEK